MVCSRIQNPTIPIGFIEFWQALWFASCHDRCVHVSAKVEYAVRACIVLARLPPGTAMSAEAIAFRAELPGKFLETILTELRVDRILATQRGPSGGCRLARSAAQISVADIFRAIEGPLADVRGEPPESMHYADDDVAVGGRVLTELWVAGRMAIRSVFETTTLADLAAGRLPDSVRAYVDLPGAWDSR